MLPDAVLIVFFAINGLLWISVIDWMIKTNRNNMKLSKMQEEYYHKTYQDNMKVNEDMSLMMHTFVKELRTAYLEKHDEV